jgi:hypothetical protein
MIDWEFELEIAQDLVNSKETYEIVTLSEGSSLHKFSYTTALGALQIYTIPECLYEEGFARMEIDGLPVELTTLPGNQIEIFWPVGMHAHANKYQEGGNRR